MKRLTKYGVRVKRETAADDIINALAEYEDAIENGQLQYVHNEPLTVKELKALEVGDYIYVRYGDNPRATFSMYMRKAPESNDEYFYDLLSLDDDEESVRLAYEEYGSYWTAYKNKEQAEVHKNNAPLSISELNMLKENDWVWALYNTDEGKIEGFYAQVHKSPFGVSYISRYLTGGFISFDKYGTRWIAYKNKEQAEGKCEACRKRLFDIIAKRLKATFNSASSVEEIDTTLEGILEEYNEDI